MQSNSIFIKIDSVPSERILTFLCDRAVERACNMSGEDENSKVGLGLALSGGGFRATLFHVGALRRLVEFGLLHKVGRISSVSGGSIVAGRLATVWETFSRDPTVESYDTLIGKPLRAFCRLNIDAAAIGQGILSPFESAAEVLESRYEELLEHKRLDQIPSSPVFVFNATNMQTGRSFRFTKTYLGDYRLGLIRDPKVPLAQAVAASSAFPPFFSPVILKNLGTFAFVEGADLNGDPTYTRELHLADGGAYDNLGLETVWNRCATVLVSDAGAPFGVTPEPARDWVRQTMRALDIATDQARALRKRRLIDDFKNGRSQGTYWGIDTDIRHYELDDALVCDAAKVSALAAMRTRLDAFSDVEQGQLINWGYALADAAIRRHAPELVLSTSRPQWPVTAFPLG